MHVPADPAAWTPHVYAELFFYLGLVVTVGLLALAMFKQRRG